MNAVPTKIVLKSTTRMSLNDRFSTITPSLQNIRANVQAEHQVSAANRRLAQQLANRPGVQQSAPGLFQQGPRGTRRGNFQQQNLQQNNRNLAQRLGQPNSAGNVKNRLTIPRGHPLRGGGGRGRGQSFNSGGGGDNQLNQRGRGGFNNFRGQQTRGAGRGRGGMQRGRGRGNAAMSQDNSFSTGLTRGRGGAQGRGRGMQRGSRGGRGRGASRGRGGISKVSQSELDSQLDQYMSKTKSSLDSELDSYMAEANV